MRARLLNTWVTLLGCVLIAITGCKPQAKPVLEKRPRPVTVVTLHKQPPPNAALVTASVASWKTEDIGFEVNGRIDFVAEPNTEIEGRLSDKTGNTVVEGTPIARIESERYELQVDKAKADVTRAEQSLIAAKTELESSFPAQTAAAKATSELAKIEFDRSQRLFAQNAGARADVDRDKANYENAVSRLQQLDAATKAKQAEVQSLRSALLQAQQDLRDAQRDLEDCTLYSSFRGQIADVAVVPGSVVDAGQAVATIQMMDPIKIELEVSGEDSRRLRNAEHLPITITKPDGTVEVREGYLYLIDPVADPLTRTFTITVLLLNKKLRNTNSEGYVATTDQTWRVDFRFLPGASEGMLFVGEEIILEDEQGPYLWTPTNLTMHSNTPHDGVLKVRKLRINRGPLKVPYLGNWVFQQITIDDEEFDPSDNLVLGKLSVSEGKPEDWNGDTVVLDHGAQWMLRPGDLVKVDLSDSEAKDGYFVPMDAIVRDENESYIFTVDAPSGHAVAKRTKIQLTDVEKNAVTSGLRRIEPADGSSLEGLHYVTRGAHYLVDGEAVHVSRDKESDE